MIRALHLSGRAAASAAALLLFATLCLAQEMPPGYAGTESCALCHEDIANAFAKNRHAAVGKEKRRGWEARACESCHGPGLKHTETTSAEDIRNPAKLPPSQADSSCLSCHTMQPTQVGRVQGSHAQNQVACATCHSVHTPPQAAQNRAARLNAQCATCHISQRAAFNRPHGHRLNQNAIHCTDCHNPHGTQMTASLRLSTGGEPGCLNCHNDKRGPFVFEHAPVRLEGCNSCHEPHGSANPRMLTRPNMAQLCLECHSNIALPSGRTNTGALGGIPPAFHDQLNPRFRNCTLCHQRVHGSHINKALLR